MLKQKRERPHYHTARTPSTCSFSLHEEALSRITNTVHVLHEEHVESHLRVSSKLCVCIMKFLSVFGCISFGSMCLRTYHSTENDYIFPVADIFDQIKIIFSVTFVSLMKRFFWINLNRNGYKFPGE